MSKYSELFKDPRWQKLRLKVLERDEFMCQQCFDSESTLHIHHRYYQCGKKPWEYNMSALLTLCESCHQIEGDFMSESCDKLVLAMKEKFLSSEIAILAETIREFNLCHVPDVVMLAIRHCLIDESLQIEIIEAYFKSLGKKKKGRNKK